MIDGPSCSCLDRNGGFGDGKHADNRPNEGSDGLELSSESIVNTPTSTDQPFMQQLGAHL